MLMCVSINMCFSVPALSDMINERAFINRLVIGQSIWWNLKGEWWIEKEPDAADYSRQDGDNQERWRRGRWRAGVGESAVEAGSPALGRAGRGRVGRCRLFGLPAPAELHRVRVFEEPAQPRHADQLHRLAVMSNSIPNWFRSAWAWRIMFLLVSAWFDSAPLDAYMIS